MEGFESSVDVSVDNRSAFTCTSVGGKGSQVSMQIEPGEFLVVHSNSPTHKKTCLKEDLKSTMKMSIQKEDEYETGNDFIEEPITGSEDAGIYDSDFVGSLTKISQEEVEEILKTCDLDRDKIIDTYRMKEFESSSYVQITNKSAFEYPSVGGKVFKGGIWMPAKNVVVKGSQVSMQIEPGEFLVVHYDSPTHEKTFLQKDFKSGMTMSIQKEDEYETGNDFIEESITCSEDAGIYDSDFVGSSTKI
ncbi:uncharacterized protein LOC128164325 [Crassostrea angulata]|uniref:uncharacterized protein LOC128164325 n=1 Tax=Magallana angulata TaxID=2784310 RepID=UPI0022B18C86|nr:uncharacterized protein LOC128164325 [Crassostrea angulata]XP_052684078.1 uncharacterized protein LOC128164325 [Crassostrea angulata]